jgi:hypothetical protein
VGKEKVLKEAFYAVSKMDELRHKDPALYRYLLLKAGSKAEDTSRGIETLMRHDGYKRERGVIRQTRR